MGSVDAMFATLTTMLLHIAALSRFSGTDDYRPLRSFVSGNMLLESSRYLPYPSRPGPSHRKAREPFSLGVGYA